MSDRQGKIASRLQIILCASKDDATAFAEAGFKSVRVVTNTESVFIWSTENAEFIIDRQLAMFDAYVLASPQITMDSETA